MRIDESKYESKILRGVELEDSTVVKIEEVSTTIFNEGKDNEREAVSVTVSGEGIKSKNFCPNMANLKVVVDAFGDETDDWIGKEIRITPVASTKLDKTPTKIIGISIPKAKK